MFEFTFLEQTEKTLSGKEFGQIKLELESMWTPALLKYIRKENDSSRLKSLIYVELLTTKRSVALSRMFSRLMAVERSTQYKNYLEDLKVIDQKYREKALKSLLQYRSEIKEYRSERDEKNEDSKLYKMNKNKMLKEQFKKIIGFNDA